MLNLGKILEEWFHRKFDLLVYLSSFLVALGWLYSIACRHRLLYASNPVVLSNLRVNMTLQTPAMNSGMKYILEWVEPRNQHLFWVKGQDDFLKRRCEVDNCYVTRNKSLLSNVADFDAVIFYGPRASIQYVKLPRNRSLHQKYMFVSTESSFNYPICDAKYDGFFNWTWTYKLDSDIPGFLTVRNAEGSIVGPSKAVRWIEVPLMRPVDDRIKTILKMKTRLAAWIVSNRNSLRKADDLVRKVQVELKKYGLQIDVYILSEDRNCGSQGRGCVELIRRKYCFSLAFENSLSDDYVTRKLLLPLQNLAIPVVYGGANYSRFMPDGIYLDAGKMAPAAMAKEMNDIIQDKDRYHSFFKWRNHYSYHSPQESPETNWLCRLCDMLHNDTLMAQRTTYPHFRQWWNRTECNSAHMKISNAWLQLFGVLALGYIQAFLHS